jgi:hypothetical protein
VATLHTSGCGTLRFLHSSSGSNSSNGASRLVLMRPGELLLWDVRSSPTRSSSTQRLQVAHPKTRLTCCEVLPGADVAAVAAEGGQVSVTRFHLLSLGTPTLSCRDYCCIGLMIPP